MQPYYTYNYSAHAHANNRIKPFKKRIFRFLLLLVLLLISFTFGAFIDVFANANEPAAANSQALLTVDVEQGDSLWSIAQNYAPENMDIREYVNKIKKINDLHNYLIQAGQILTLP